VPPLPSPCGAGRWCNRRGKHDRRAAGRRECGRNECRGGRDDCQAGGSGKRRAHRRSRGFGGIGGSRDFFRLFPMTSQVSILVTKRRDLLSSDARQPEVVHLFVVLEHALPNREQLQRITRETAADKPENAPTGENLDRSSMPPPASPVMKPKGRSRCPSSGTTKFVHRPTRNGKLAQQPWLREFHELSAANRIAALLFRLTRTDKKSVADDPGNPVGWPPSHFQTQ
jgi:hypothetical protein